MITISIFITLLTVFHISSFSYSRSKRVAQQFHPFLQIKPRPVDTNLLCDTNSFRIVCIGGSTTEFCDTKGNSWPDYLDSILNTIDGLPNVHVLNCGMQWYSTLHMLVHYQTNIRRYKPDLLIVMEAINDLLPNADQSDFSNGRFREDYGHFYGPVGGLVGAKRTFTGYVMSNMRRIWYQPVRTVLELDSFPGLATYERNIKTIIDLARMDGTAVVIMTQPTSLKRVMSTDEVRQLTMVNFETIGQTTRWSYQTAWRGMEQYNNRVRDISHKQGVQMIDLEKTVPKNTEYFKDDVHYRDKAFPLVAATIARELTEHTVIRSTNEKK
ncbi:MAG TPA: SGNH/GDSL hydrolase family protein [Chitinispirillaceae bacterium]|nr:SGNH/GDSL hydrolase family protein [Chitinispirillaceae bacterium]